MVAGATLRLAEKKNNNNNNTQFSIHNRGCRAKTSVEDQPAQWTSTTRTSVQ